MKHLFSLLFTIVILAAGPSGLAEEKNGLSVTVAKTTLGRNDMRGGYYYDRIDRTQGLKATIKNTSFKPMPEGEIKWQILVRKYLTNVVDSYTGTEKLKALKTGESQEMVFGSAEITGWKDGVVMEKDKTEWQIVVTQGGVEMIKAQSTSSFDALAKRAVAVRTPAQPPK